jgi:heme/copper-type cytochrome/quinol oxidase subunit 2
MGDQKGPFFGNCETWSHESNPSSMGQCSSKLSDGAKIAIGVSVGVVVIVVGVVIAVVIFRKKRNKQRNDYDSIPGSQ